MKEYLKVPLVDFPNSENEPFIITSEATGSYNCIGWALEETNKFYWPGPKAFYNWPDDIHRRSSLPNLVKIFKKAGYSPCENGDLEMNFQKIALFAIDKIPTHAARQLPDGFWTSKIGALEDVKHTLDAISGGIYGDVVLFMSRKQE